MRILYSFYRVEFSLFFGEFYGFIAVNKQYVINVLQLFFMIVVAGLITQDMLNWT